MTRIPARRRLQLPRPRLLPLTIVAMAALLLVKSAVLVRAAVPAASPANAGAPHADLAIPPPPAERVGAAAAPPPAPAAVPACPVPISDTERALLLDLRHRRAELDAREAGLAAREGVLSAAEKRMGERVAELTGLRQRLEGLETARKARDDANWQGLVKLYETMKPREAATIFNDLDKPVLLQVLDRMSERKAAPVLAAMQPERARQITTELARLREQANHVPPAPPNR
jgi:flagellar motility protein MotE (MotC chaperone)